MKLLIEGIGNCEPLAEVLLTYGIGSLGILEAFIVSRIRAKKELACLHDL